MGKLIKLLLTKWIELKSDSERKIELLKELRIVITRFRAERKRNEIEMKYKYMFELLDLDYYQYLELVRMKKKELLELESGL